MQKKVQLLFSVKMWNTISKVVINVHNVMNGNICRRTNYKRRTTKNLEWIKQGNVPVFINDITF